MLLVGDERQLVRRSAEPCEIVFSCYRDPTPPCFHVNTNANHGEHSHVTIVLAERLQGLPHQAVDLLADRSGGAT